MFTLALLLGSLVPAQVTPPFVDVPPPREVENISRTPQPSDFIHAAGLLTAPINTPEQCSKEQFPALREAIQKTAVDWQIMDPRETRYVMAEYEEFEQDLNLLRKRYGELKDLPLIEEASWRFPSRNECHERIKFNRAFLKHLEERMVWEQDRADIIQVVIDETNYAFRVWDAIRDCQCDFYYISVRRAAMGKFKDLVGQKKWDDMIIPDNVPSWRFNTR